MMEERWWRWNNRSPFNLIPAKVCPVDNKFLNVLERHPGDDSPKLYLYPVSQFWCRFFRTFKEGKEFILKEYLQNQLHEAKARIELDQQRIREITYTLRSQVEAMQEPDDE